MRKALQIALAAVAISPATLLAQGTTVTSGSSTSTSTNQSFGPRVTYQSWDVFTSPTGPNAPDRGLFNPNGAPELGNTEATAFITSSQNIYSYQAPIAPVVTIPNYAASDATWTTLFLDVGTMGRRIDLGSVLVNGHAPVTSTLNNTSVVDPLPPGHSDGGNADAWSFTFQIPGNAANYELSFLAGGTSMSLASLAVSTIYTTDAEPIGGQGARYPFDNLFSTGLVTADANGDGLITSADAATVARNFGLRSGASWADGDFDLDGTVGLKDLMTLQRAGLSLGGGPTTVQAALAQHAVPEPGAVTLASMAFACLSASCLMRRRKRHSPHQPLRN